MGGIVKINIRGNNLIVFLNNNFVSEIDFCSRSGLEKYFRNFFIKLSDIYGLEFSGGYDISVFVDDRFGVVFSITSNDSYDYDFIDMNIIVSAFKGFLFKSCDLVFDIDCDVYFYEGSFYYDPLVVNSYIIGYLFENFEIVYGKKVCDIRDFGILNIDKK